MKLGMIGLGKMGANMTQRLVAAGHTVVGYDRSAEAVTRVTQAGAGGANSLEDLVAQLEAPRCLWVMVPSDKPVDETIVALTALCEKDDIIIDGGNSNYKETMRRGAAVREAGMHLVDAGTSGGIWGLKEGYSLMVGGSKEAVQRIQPILESLAPAADKGWGHVGPPGSGHFTKMIHNGIEYGMMQAMAEGFAILKSKEEFDLDLHQISELWRFGSVIRSWLLDLTADAFKQNVDLEGVAAFVPDSGEGRWTVFEAIDLNVSAPVITDALLRRIRSREEAPLADKILAVMRNQFGGHAVKTEK